MAHKETMRLPAKHAWGVAVFCILLALQASFRFWDGPERSFHDLASTSLTHPAGLPLALVAIDDASLSAVGPWPWSRTTLAQLIDTLSRAKPKAIVVALPAVASQAERSMFTLQSLKDLLANAHDTAASSPAAATDIPSDRLAPIAALVDKAMASAQDNVRWEQSLQSAGNVLLVPSEALPGALSKSQELSYQVPQMVSCLDVL
jgi:serine/threonine-protein kinase